jgi:glycosyltransferase involved in cell wall biosynthesis
MNGAPTPALLSVVIPTWNRRELVARAVRSVLAQEGALPVEVIVVDDGSSDGTAAALQAEFGADARVRVLESARRHASGARNLGFAAAGGEWICFLDSDDFWLPGAHAAFGAVFAADPALAFVSLDGATSASAAQPSRHGVVRDAPGWSHPRFATAGLATDRLDLPGGVTARRVRGDFFPAIVNADLFYLSAMVMRRGAVVAAGPFNERLRFFNDWEFFARLCLAGPGAYVDGDAFRRDTGRDDQISRRRPLTALPRRHLFLLRTLQRRCAGDARRSATLAAALPAAEYRMAHCLAASGRGRRARRYLYHCIQVHYKPLRCLARAAATFLPIRRSARPAGW